MAVLEEVAFRRLDIKIAKLLLKLSENKQDDLKIKHQDIAMELGSSREVVSSKPFITCQAVSPPWLPFSSIESIHIQSGLINV